RGFNQARQAVIVQGAQKVAAAGNDPELALHYLDSIEKNGVYSSEQIDQFRKSIKEGGTEAVAKITSYLMGPQKGVVVPRGATVINPITNQPMATGAAIPPTKAELAVKAAAGDAQAKAALDAMQTPQRRTEAEAALDAFAKTLGKTNAEELTDAER